VLVAAAITLTALPSGARAAPATVWSWGGTATTPTGVLTIRPGLTNTPAPSPADFSATVELIR
jgi:hypothetical protein